MSFQDFQKAPNRLTAREIIFLVIAGAIIVILLYGLAIGNYYLAGQIPDGGEFVLLRVGGRAFLFDRLEPYSGSVPALVQEQVYNRPAEPGQDPYILDVPFPLLIFFFPLALFPDALMARAFWMALTELALAGYIFLAFRLLDRHVSYLLMGLIAISSFTSFYAYRSFSEGSPVILLGLAYLGILISLQKGHDELAGALISLSAFQWEIGGLFLAFIAMWAFWGRRWRVYAGAAMFSFILMVVTYFWYPGWIIPFLRASWNSVRVGFEFSTHEILTKLFPQYGDILGWILTAVLIAMLSYEWRTARQAHFDHLVWVVCLTLAATPLLGQPVELDHLFPLTMPIMLIIMIPRDRWGKLGAGIAFVLLWFFFGFPWLFINQGIPAWVGLSKEEVLFLFWPIFSLLGTLAVRWWMIRAPRTWLDNITPQERR